MHSTQKRWFVYVTLPLYLAMIWLVSGVSRQHGLIYFLIGSAVGMIGWVAFLGRRPRLLFLSYFAVLLAAGTVAGLEISLRAAPALLTGTVANFAYSGYHDLPGGIYQRDAHLGESLRPNHCRSMYWNGHWWHHETNAKGYRGPLTDQADAVFLGDSMIYGHGVETAATVSSRFGIHTGLKVANLGQQGTCPLQMWIRLRRLGIVLRPRVVFICCHPNDIEEVCSFYDVDELQGLLTRPVEDDTEPWVKPSLRPKSPWDLQQFWNDHLAHPLRTAGALVGLQTVWQQRSQRMPEPVEDENRSRGLPSAAQIAFPFNPEAPAAPAEQRLGWLAHGRALAKIGNLCRQLGATLVLFDLGYPRAFSEAHATLARQIGAAYHPAGQVALLRAQAGEDIYLARDGHWSTHGCDVVAEELAQAYLQLKQ